MPVNLWDFLETLGAALYRVRRYEEAEQRLNEAQADQDGKNGSSSLWLALAHHRLGQTQEAWNWLTQAEQWMEQQSERESLGEEPLPWEARAAYDILHREAEAVLQRK